MLPWKYRLLLGGGTLALATWVGYRAECRVMDSAGSKPVTFQSVVRRATAPKARTEKIDKLNEIRHRAGRTEISAAESAAAWEIIRAFTVEDVKACLEEIPATPRREVNETLMSMLFFRWGQLDPQAAAEMASQSPYRENRRAIAAVATAWADRDPEAALRWAAKSDSYDAKGTMGSMAGKMLAQQNPATALDRALAEFPFAAGNVALSLAMRTDDSEESRKAVLLRLVAQPDKRLLERYVTGLSRRAASDPELASAFVAELERAGVEHSELASIQESLKAGIRRYERQEFPTVERGLDANLPVEQQKADYATWSYYEPEKAVAWAAQSGRADLVSGVVKRQSVELLRSNWQPGQGDQDSGRGEQRLVSQYETWRKLDPATAESWLKTMPADLRNHLSPSSNNAPR